MTPVDSNSHIALPQADLNGQRGYPIECLSERVHRDGRKPNEQRKTLKLKTQKLTQGTAKKPPKQKARGKQAEIHLRLKRFRIQNQLS